MLRICSRWRLSSVMKPMLMVPSFRVTSSLAKPWAMVLFWIQDVLRKIGALVGFGGVAEVRPFWASVSFDGVAGYAGGAESTLLAKAGIAFSLRDGGQHLLGFQRGDLGALVPRPC